MTFVERGRDESLAEHLLKNANALCLDRDQRARLTVAFRLMQGTWADRIEGSALARDVQAQLKDDLKAVVDAAGARGEKVVAYNEAGAKRIKGRDGLVSLHASGSLGVAELVAGAAFRHCLEVTSAGLRSGLGTAGQVRGGKDFGRSPFEGRDKGELHRAYVVARLNQFERAVRAVDSTDGLSGRMLLLVAGEGHALWSLCSGGHARAKGLEALKLGLDAVAGVLAVRKGVANHRRSGA